MSEVPNNLSICRIKGEILSCLFRYKRSGASIKLPVASFDGCCVYCYKYFTTYHLIIFDFNADIHDSMF
jgi:hypothetical protein